MPEPARSRDPIPGFELLAVLGEGGMATVFKAREVATGRSCALKVLRAHELSPRRRGLRLERFRREGQLIAALDHPNVVRAFGKGETKDTA